MDELDALYPSREEFIEKEVLCGQAWVIEPNKFPYPRGLGRDPSKNPGFFDFRVDEKIEIFAVLGWDEEIRILRFSWIFVILRG